MVSSNHVTLFIHTQAAVCIAVVSKADVALILYHKLLQTTNVCRSSIVVNVRTIGLCVDDKCFCSKCVKNGLCNIPGRAICTVKRNLNTLEGIDAKRNQITHIAISARHIVNCTTNMVTRGKRKLVPRLSKQIQLSIQIVFYQIDGFLIHLFSVPVDEFDAIVVVGIMTCGNHNAAVKLIHTGNVGHGRRGGDVE